MLLASVSFLVSGFLEAIIQTREANGKPQVHVLWQLPQVTIITVAEIFLSVTGLEFAYATSPDRLKAFLMALVLAYDCNWRLVWWTLVFQRLSRHESIRCHVCVCCSHDGKSLCILFRC